MISPLAQTHIDQIHREGYAILKQAVAPSIVQELLSFACNFQYSAEEQAFLLGNQQRLNGYARSIFNIALKRPDALKLFIRRLQGEVMRGLLNDKYYAAIPAELPNYILRSMLLRSSLDAMPYHIDSFIPYEGNNTSVVQSVLFLNDSKIDNGCTLVVPHSHNSGQYASQGDNPKAIPLQAESGDVVIWDSRLWHATLENTAKRDRWALVGTFCRWYIKQGFDYPRAIPPEMFNALEADEKIVYGYCSYTPISEFDKTELKSGLNSVKMLYQGNAGCK